MEILQNIKIALEINGQGQMAPITSREHRNTYSYHVTYISDQYHSSYCARAQTRTGSHAHRPWIGPKQYSASRRFVVAQGKKDSLSEDNS